MGGGARYTPYTDILTGLSECDWLQSQTTTSFHAPTKHRDKYMIEDISLDRSSLLFFILSLALVFFPVLDVWSLVSS